MQQQRRLQGVEPHERLVSAQLKPNGDPAVPGGGGKGQGSARIALVVSLLWHMLPR